MPDKLQEEAEEGMRQQAAKKQRFTDEINAAAREIDKHKEFHKPQIEMGESTTENTSIKE